MFTGIIETTGSVQELQSDRLVLNVPFADELVIGQSVAVNGACLTVIEKDDQSFAVEVMDETWKRTVLGDLKEGYVVNVELAMRVNGRFDGHIVQGHVDGVGDVLRAEKVKSESGEDFHEVDVELPSELIKYVVQKGSICLDGVSLTVIKVVDNVITVGIIPHTWKVTNLHTKEKGCKIHVEVDVLAKYVEKMLKSSS